MFGNSSSASKILDGFLGLLGFILFLFIAGPATIIILITQCYRMGLILYVKLFRLDIVRIMAENSPVMAIDDIHVRPLCTVVGYGVFEGATVEHLIQIVKNGILDIDRDTGEFRYPELHQYFEEWMGYIWWKWEQNCQLKNHIVVLDEGRNESNPVLEKDLIRIIATLEAKPFPSKQSPWDVVIIGNVLLENVKNPNHPKAALIYRCHHGLVDGMSMLQMVMKCVLKESMNKIQKPAFHRRDAVKTVFLAWNMLQLPYLFLKQFVFAFDNNEWHISQEKLSRKMYRACTKRISISLIKDIKNKHQVGFTAVLISVVSGALRKMMMKHNVKVPKRMNSLVPLPWKNHPQKLCNHWSLGFMELPTGEASTLQRLHHINNYIDAMKHSLLPAFNFVFITITNILPTWCIKKIDIANRMPTVLLSNFPGPPPESIGLDFKLVDAMFTLGPLRGSMGINVCIMSYDDAVRIVVGVDSAIFKTQEMAYDLIETIEQEFSKLQN